MIKTMKTLVLLLFITMSYVVVVLGAGESPASPRPRLVLQLIHRDTIFHNAASNNSTASLTSGTDKYWTALTPGDQVKYFFVNVSVGTPPVIQLLVMDTGSPFTWVQNILCVYTECKSQVGPYYNTWESTTYHALNCDSPRCGAAPGQYCAPGGDDRYCMYLVSYQDGARSEGLVSTDTFAFLSEDEYGAAIVAPVPEVTFGAGSTNRDKHDLESSGIFGLGPGNTSIINRLGPMFSYCVGDLKNASYQYNRLVMGREAFLLGNPSPLTALNGKYFVNLEKVAFGGDDLHISPDDIRLKPDGSGGLIIDSGTVLTYLPPSVYEPIQNAIEQRMLPRERVPGTDRLCYDGNLELDIENQFPSLYFNFTNGAVLELDAQSIFRQIAIEGYCTTFQLSEASFGTIGMYAQQQYNVGYNIPNNTIHFWRIPCEFLFDTSIN